MNKDTLHHRPCAVEKCFRTPILAKGFCSMHYKRQYKHGNTGFAAPTMSYLLSFSDIKSINTWLINHRKITENGCWEWSGPVNKSGYGLIIIDHKRIRVHRVACALYKDFNINSDFIICHHCDNPPCFNPEHLFIGTHKDNILDCIHKNRARKKYGVTHPNAKLNEDNVKEIRKRRANGETYTSLSKVFGISWGNIERCCKRITWKQVI